MAYCSPETKAKIMAALKRELAKFDVRWTLKVEHHSSVTLTIREGSIEFRETRREHSTHARDLMAGDEPDDAREVLLAAARGLRSEFWDKSDLQTDYFHCAYYMHLHVGTWDQPYKLRPPRSRRVS